MLKSILTICIMAVITVNAQKEKSGDDGLKFIPVEHATLVIESKYSTVYVDPVGPKKAYKDFKRPDVILITHGHKDHFDAKSVKSLMKRGTQVIAPMAVIRELRFGNVLNNGQNVSFRDFKIEAVAMYNTSKERENYHPRGVGNGYVLKVNNKKIYISGDTEDTPEMRSLANVDYAFICMNLPFTMSVEQAASAVVEMKPRVVYPYHYRGKKGKSDVEKFRKLVLAKTDLVEVRLMDWYPVD